MNASNQAHPAGPAGIYHGFISAVNRQDLDEAAKFVDPDRYRENCVGFTRGLWTGNARRSRSAGSGKGFPICGWSWPRS